MNIYKSVSFIQKKITLFDWKLLLFLILFLDVKLSVKVIAIVIIYILQPDFRFQFGFKNIKPFVFYLSIILIATLNWLLSKGFLSQNYTIAFLTGIAFWGLSILALHQIQLFTRRTDTSVIHRTISLFFVLNALVSMITLIGIIWEIKEINPYLYQGQYQKYFIGTGDYIRGITFDVSTTNAIINAFGIVYFLIRKNLSRLFLCMIILLLTGSNFTNLLLVFVFLYLFIFKTDLVQKSSIVVCIMLCIVFMVKISPQNNLYAQGILKKIIGKKNVAPVPTPALSIQAEKNEKEKIAQNYLDSVAASLQRKQIITVKNSSVSKTATSLIEKPIIPGDSIHTPTFQSRKDTNAFQKELISFSTVHLDGLTASQKLYAASNFPGKIIAFKQSLQFLNAHPFKMLIGTGIGNFSSKLAFRITGLKLAGGYPSKFIYISPYFLKYHFNLFLYFFSKNIQYHSLINNPASVYDQLLCEYGIIGLAAFFILYIGYFFSYRKQLSYGFPLLLLLVGAFTVDYWYEQLSIVILFELMLLLDIKESTTKKVIDD
jgi:hypothetical protein